MKRATIPAIIAVIEERFASLGKAEVLQKILCSIGESIKVEEENETGFGFDGKKKYSEKNLLSLCKWRIYLDPTGKVCGIPEEDPLY